MPVPDEQRKVFPAATAVLLLLGTGVTLLQFAFPAVLETLRRDPASLAAGQWWRIITPLVVHADGIWQFAANVISLVIVGAYAERRVGTLRIAVVYIVCGLAGEIAGYAWEPHGAGMSVAICGALGCSLVAEWRRPEGANRIVTAWLAGYPAAILGNALGNAATAAIAASLASLLTGIPAVTLMAVSTSRTSAAIGLALAVCLSALGNIHGPPVLVGVLFGIAFVPAGKAGHGRQARGWS